MSRSVLHIPSEPASEKHRSIETPVDSEKENGKDPKVFSKTLTGPRYLVFSPRDSPREHQQVFDEVGSPVVEEDDWRLAGF